MWTVLDVHLLVDARLATDLRGRRTRDRGIGPSLIPFVSFTIGNAVGSFMLVDRVGRRVLLLFGMITMCLTMLVGGSIALLAHDPVSDTINETAGVVIVTMIVIYMLL